MESSRPKVSVSLVTYNHVDFIGQAIESILMQETDFEYELVIGEDGSSDGTREIVKAYRDRYTSKIKLLLNDRENVIYIQGRPTGRWNFANNLKHSTGEYVALLDGDDYWTSPDKLQKQVDFLDSHPECAICFHAIEIISQDGKRAVRIDSPPGAREIYTLQDLLMYNFVAICSVVFRNNLVAELPDWYFTLPVGDWPLYILNAQHGDIGYIAETMAVHRHHSGGVWSVKDLGKKAQDEIEILTTLQQRLGLPYDRLLEAAILWRRCQIGVAKGNRWEALMYLARFLARYRFSPYVITLRWFLIVLLRSISPRLYELARSTSTGAGGSNAPGMQRP